MEVVEEVFMRDSNYTVHMRTASNERTTSRAPCNPRQQTSMVRSLKKRIQKEGPCLVFRSAVVGKHYQDLHYENFEKTVYAEWSSIPFLRTSVFVERPQPDDSLP